MNQKDGKEISISIFLKGHFTLNLLYELMKFHGNNS